MSFYTSVTRYGNAILYRGYNAHGKKIYKRDSQFKPVFYTQAQKETGWKSLDGVNIAPIEMDNMREAKQWLEMNREVSGRHVYGNKNYMHFLFGLALKCFQQIKFEKSKYFQIWFWF